MRLKNDLKYIATPAKVFTTLVILLIALLIVQSIILETERMFFQTKPRSAIKPKAQPTPEEERLDRIRYSEKMFLPDGTIHLVHRLRPAAGRVDEPETMQIYDANDKLLWQGPISRRPYNHISWAGQLSSYRKIVTQQQMRQMQTITPELSRTLEVPIQSEQQAIQIWRYNPAYDYFIGYDTDGKEIGYISSAGFTELKANAKPFGQFKLFAAWCPQDSSSPTLLWQTQRRIYQIDFKKRNVDLIFESADADVKTISLHGWRDIAPGKEGSTDYKTYRPLIHCVTEDGKNHLIMREPEQRLTITIPEDWESWAGNLYRFTATRQAIFMYRYWTEASSPPDYRKSPKIYQQWWRNFRSQPQKYWVELYRVDNQGGFELLNHYSWTEPALSETVVEARDFRTPATRYVSKFSPPLYDLVWYPMIRGFWMFAYRDNDLSRGFARMLADIRPAGSVINWLLSVPMIGFAFWHGWPRRTSWPKFLFWLAFVGLFNLAGLLTYLALNHTAVIKCSACGRRRGLTQVNCVRCGVELPAPKRGKLDLIFNT